MILFCLNDFFSKPAAIEFLQLVDLLGDCMNDCRDRACPVSTLSVWAVEHSKAVNNLKTLVGVRMDFFLACGH